MGKKTPKAPAAPDYSALAVQQAGLDNAALDKQNAYNTVNQDTAYGSQRYTTNPDGTRNLTTTLNPADQARLDQQRGMASGLLGQAENNFSKPMDTSGLPDWGKYDESKLTQVDLGQMGRGQQDINTSNLTQGIQGVDPSALQQGVPGMGSLNTNHYGMDPTGNSQAIQDATYKLLQPQRDQSRQTEIQRLANQGITEGTPAFDRAMLRLEQGDTDAQLKSLLAGQQEYGQAFNRGLNQNQNNFGQDTTAANFANQSNQQRFGQNSEQQRLALALRGQQFGENADMANLGLAKNDQLWGQDTDRARLGMSQADQQWGRQNDILNMNASQRGAMLGEQNMLRQQPMNDLQSLLNTMPTDPAFGSYQKSAGSVSPDMMGAANNQYTANMNNFNAKNAGKSNMLGGLMGLAGSVMGGPVGGMLGSKVGSMF